MIIHALYILAPISLSEQIINTCTKVRGYVVLVFHDFKNFIKKFIDKSVIEAIFYRVKEHRSLWYTIQ